MYRLVICIDVAADNLVQAYNEVYNALNKSPPSIEWESTDEAYDPHGVEIEPEEIQRVRMTQQATRATHF